MPKTALVESGGGMAACYIAGVTYALAKHFRDFKPDIVIGASGSSGTLSYYVAGQPESMKRIWLSLLSDKNFINPLRVWRVMNIDYLIDEVLKKQEPLNAEKIYQSDILYFIPSTNHRTGKLEYFSNRNGDDIFESMRASMALPIAFNKYIKVKHKEYCDSYISASVHLNIEQALKLGADRIIVVSVEDAHPSKLVNLFYNFWLKHQSRKFLKNYHKEEKESYVIPDSVEIIHISPKNNLEVGTFGNSKESLQKVFEQGYKDTVNNERLKSILRVTQ